MTTYYRSGSNFRLGGNQYDACPHKHRSPELAARCAYWDTYFSPHGTVVLEMTMQDGHERQIGVIRVSDAALRESARAYALAHEQREKARDALAHAVRDAVAGGMTETEAASVAGVNRLTVRAWLGKS